MSFSLRDGGYDAHDHQVGPESPERRQMRDVGWPHRRRVARAMEFNRRLQAGDCPDFRGGRRENGTVPFRPDGRPAGPLSREEPAGGDPGFTVVDVPGEVAGTRRVPAAEAETGTADGTRRVPATFETAPSQNPFARRDRADATANPFGDGPGTEFNAAEEQHTGIVLGMGLVSFRTPDGEDQFLALPGDDVKLTFPTAGTPPKAVSDDFTIVDFYESKMSEYDTSFVFVPIRKLQELRGMIDPSTGIGMVSSIQIKLKEGADGDAVRDKLRKAFAPELYSVQTWRDKQGALLAAVQMETAILNVLLFLIIAVAGFGILAIFLMIVIEKTKDIGILKSLGASRGGVMGIFLGYGLSLGMVGSGVGMVIGLLFVRYINEIAALLGWLTGRPVFDPSIYYFYKIPTIVSPLTVGWIVAGAMGIAVLASVLPALRAAMLHPVEALRYE